LIEGSFAQAANEHWFKRSRWRRLWRQQIQDWLIAAVQNVKLLLRAGGQRAGSGAAAVRAGFWTVDPLAAPSQSGRLGRGRSTVPQPGQPLKPCSRACLRRPPLSTTPLGNRPQDAPRGTRGKLFHLPSGERFGSLSALREFVEFARWIDSLLFISVEQTMRDTMGGLSGKTEQV
jgi:hypothetical protein